MKLFHVTVCTALLLGGCATSPKTFYADPAKPNDTELCRVVMDASADPAFKADVANELIRRGMTEKSCADKVNIQNAVVVGAAIVGLTAAAVIACNNNACPSGGGGGYYDDDVDCAGGSGNGPRYVNGPTWVGSYDPYRLDADHDGWGCEASDLSIGA